jgi:hypothetical protein
MVDALYSPPSPGAYSDADAPPDGYVRIRILQPAVIGMGSPVTDGSSTTPSGPMVLFPAGSVVEVLASAMPAGQNLPWLLDDTTGLPL